VRAALDRILDTEAFRQNHLLARLLSFAVEESLAGRGCALKESQATRLRAQLREYYSGEGLEDPVRIHLPEGGHAAEFSLVAPSHRRARRRLWFWLPPALAAALLIGWAGSWWHARAASAAVRSVAVLPFADLSPHRDGDWFGDGMAAEIMDALAHVPGLRVAARTSSFAFRGGTRDLAKIGRQLGVAAAIEGSILQAGGRLHIDVRMNRTSDGYLLWSKSFDRPAKDVPAAGQSIAAALAGRLQLPGAALRPRPHEPPPEAYSAYLQGRYFFQRDDLDSLGQAAQRLEEATRIDPEFALAWAWLSMAREYIVDDGGAQPNQAMPGSRDAAERAVALDSDCGEAHLALGIVKLQYDWDWAGARQELDRALQLNPGSALALHWSAHWFETQGRMAEATAEMERALTLDPLSAVILGDLAGQYLSANQMQRADPLARRALELEPDDASARAVLAGGRFFAGHSPGGAKLPPFVLACMAARQGDPAEARRLLNQAEDLPGEQLLPATDYVQLAAALHDWERLFLWLDEAYDRRDVRLPYLPLSPDMPKSDARFATFLGRMNLPAPAR
jgi:serine/threonine-protein kinase